MFKDIYKKKLSAELYTEVYFDAEVAAVIIETEQGRVTISQNELGDIVKGMMVHVR